MFFLVILHDFDQFHPERPKTHSQRPKTQTNQKKRLKTQRRAPKKTRPKRKKKQPKWCFLQHIFKLGFICVFMVRSKFELLRLHVVFELLKIARARSVWHPVSPQPMASQPLKSNLWSCSSLDEALSMLKQTERMPDDPNELQKMIQDNPAQIILNSNFYAFLF